MRQQAHKAGNLNSNEQEKVTTQGNTIIIEPANPEVVYVPPMIPGRVWRPIVAYPGWYPCRGSFLLERGLDLESGSALVSSRVWLGLHHWGCDWHGHRVIYNHNTYISHAEPSSIATTLTAAAVIQPWQFNHGNALHGSRPGAEVRVSRSSAPHFQPGTRSGAFSGFDHGGNVRGFSSRGRSSLEVLSWCGFHGGGGGRHR